MRVNNILSSLLLITIIGALSGCATESHLTLGSNAPCQRYMKAVEQEMNSRAGRGKVVWGDPLRLRCRSIQ